MKQTNQIIFTHSVTGRVDITGVAAANESWRRIMAAAQFVNKPEYFTLIWREQLLITSPVLGTLAWFNFKCKSLVD